MSSNAALLSKKDLIGRGWTRAGIRRFLGDPDATKPNPCYRSAPPMCLYASARAEAIESTEEWRGWRDRKNARSAASTRVAEKKAEELRAEVDRWRPKLPKLPIKEVRRRAIRAYNERNALDGGPGADESSDAGFLDRIVVNYLRHETTDYDSMLAEVAGRIGVRTAERMIRGRVYGAIADRYPELAPETARQMQSREIDVQTV